MKDKLPKVGIYITNKEFHELLESHRQITSIAKADGENMKMIKMRVDGIIGYHDLKEIRISALKEAMAVVPKMVAHEEDNVEWNACIYATQANIKSLIDKT